jgi:hypothetical protein
MMLHEGGDGIRLFYASSPPRFESLCVVILYQRDNCHLCDLALGVLAEARTPDFDSVFIDDDATLEARYGERVPVLRDAVGRELDWPFDAARLRAWLSG